jgi:hypothetical protein
MALPTFFILGAARCGTTAMADWLNRHPNVAITQPKEPTFYAPEMAHSRYGHILNRDEYEAVVPELSDTILATGDASPWHLTSKQALQRIKADLPNAKSIILVRPPWEMAMSLHGRLIKSGIESVRDFVSAWHLQENRSHGRQVPAGCLVSTMLQYRQLCSIGSQVQTALNIFGREKVLILFLDKLRDQPEVEFAKVTDFLGVPSWQPDSFARVNGHETPRSSLLNRLLVRPPTPVLRTLRSVKSILGVSRTGILARINSVNMSETSRPPLPPEFVQQLIKEFQEEVEILESMTSRDLSEWFRDRRGFGDLRASA